MPAVSSIQAGRLTITSGDGLTGTIPIASVDLSRAVVIGSNNTASGATYRTSSNIFQWEFDSPTAIRWTRNSTAGATDCPASWHVIEFDPSILRGGVQSGTYVMDNSLATEDIVTTLGLADAAHAFVLFSSYYFNQEPEASHLQLYELIDANTIRTTRTTTSGNTSPVAWFVVDMDPAELLSAGYVELLMSGSTLEDTLPLAGYTPASKLVGLGSGHNLNLSSPTRNDRFPGIGYVSAYDTATFTRSAAAGGYTGTYGLQVLEFQESSVEIGYGVNPKAGPLVLTFPLPDLDPDSAMLLHQHSYWFATCAMLEYNDRDPNDTAVEIYLDYGGAGGEVSAIAYAWNDNMNEQKVPYNVVEFAVAGAAPGVAPQHYHHRHHNLAG